MEGQYQCDSKAPKKQIGCKGDASGSFPFTCLPDTQVEQGKKAGERKGSHQPRRPEGDAEQCHKLDVPVADPAVCGKGDGKQEQEAGQESQGAAQHGFRESHPRAGICCQREGKETPGQEGKQGGIAYPVVPVIV